MHSLQAVIPIFLTFGNPLLFADQVGFNNGDRLTGTILKHLITRDGATLDLLGGANFTRENYAEVQRNLAAGQFGEEFTLKLGKNTSLSQNIAFFPDLTESGNYRINFSLGTLTKVVKWLGWQNNFSDVYVTNPRGKETKRVRVHLRFECGFRSLINRIQVSDQR